MKRARNRKAKTTPTKPPAVKTKKVAARPSPIMRVTRSNSQYLSPAPALRLPLANSVHVIPTPIIEYIKLEPESEDDDDTYDYRGGKRICYDRPTSLSPEYSPLPSPEQQSFEYQYNSQEVQYLQNYSWSQVDITTINVQRNCKIIMNKIDCVEQCDWMPPPPLTHAG